MNKIGLIKSIVFAALIVFLFSSQITYAQRLNKISGGIGDGSGAPPQVDSGTNPNTVLIVIATAATALVAWKVIADRKKKKEIEKADTSKSKTAAIDEAIFNQSNTVHNILLKAEEKLPKLRLDLGLLQDKYYSDADRFYLGLSFKF